MYEDIEELYLYYYRDLYLYIMKLCPEADFASDIIQNTFLAAMKSIENFRGDSSIKTWLFSIAKHELYSYLRKNKHYINIDDISENAGKNIDVSDKIIADEILKTIEKLSPPLNEIMKLRSVYGLSFKEIGYRTGKTENYCRVNFYRIKEKLRKEYHYE